MAATGARLAIIDLDGSEPVAPATDDRLDKAHRRLPPHLDSHRVTWRGARRVDRWGLHRLGFRRRPRRPPLLTLPW